MCIVCEARTSLEVLSGALQILSTIDYDMVRGVILTQALGENIHRLLEMTQENIAATGSSVIDLDTLFSDEDPEDVRAKRIMMVLNIAAAMTSTALREAPDQPSIPIVKTEELALFDEYLRELSHREGGGDDDEI